MIIRVAESRPASLRLRACSNRAVTATASAAASTLAARGNSQRSDSGAPLRATTTTATAASDSRRGTESRDRSRRDHGEIRMSNDLNPRSQTFYRRPLPTTCIALSSAEGRSRFENAMKSGGCESYFHLSEQFTTQADPAFCGISSLVMVLNALSMDPGRSWIGSVWRWYHEDMMDGVCRNLDHVRRNGVTLAEFCCMARCHGCEVSINFANGSDTVCEGSLAHFRAAIDQSLCSRPTDECARRFLVASYRSNLPDLC
jgi:hypothetical protein